MEHSEKTCVDYVVTKHGLYTVYLKRLFIPMRFIRTHLHLCSLQKNGDALSK